MDDHSSNSKGATMLLVNLNPSSSRGSPRSVSPMTPSPTRDLRGLSLFRAISRRLGRQRHHNVDDEDDDEDETSQSSTDSDDRSSGSAGVRVSRSKKCSGNKKKGFLHRSASCIGSDSGLLHMHGSHSTGGSEGSSSGSDTSSGHVPRHNAASSSSSLHQASSFRRVFQSLTRNSRSHSASCATSITTSTNTDSKRRVSDGTANSEKKKNKSILRAPVAYTYVRGLSGLPTQRVPRGYPCVYLPTNVCCGSPRFGTQHLAGLNR